MVKDTRANVQVILLFLFYFIFGGGGVGLLLAVRVCMNEGLDSVSRVRDFDFIPFNRLCL